MSKQNLELLDLGDRVLSLGFVHARAGGVELEEEFAQLNTLREGLVAHSQSLMGPMKWEEGLRSAGLDPAVIALPKQRNQRQAVRSKE